MISKSASVTAALSMKRQRRDAVRALLLRPFANHSSVSKPSCDRL